MSMKKRWIHNTIEAAENGKQQMPWERGERRQAMIARRTDTDADPIKVTLAPIPVWMTEPLTA